jgi:hypothetical protein
MTSTAISPRDFARSSRQGTIKQSLLMRAAMIAIV